MIFRSLNIGKFKLKNYLLYDHIFFNFKKYYL